ncbi:hypothetical protein LINGRAHAP2_LOCUS7118 [Linum grandiflorum]
MTCYRRSATLPCPNPYNDHECPYQMSRNRDEVLKWTSWKAASTYFNLNINLMFVRSSTRDLRTSIECYSSCTNSDQERSQIRAHSLRSPSRFRLDVCMPLQKERLVTLHGGREVMSRFRYERLHTFCFICDILGHKEQKCELRYQFPEDQLPFLWDDSIKVVSHQEARAQTTNSWLRVRSRIEPG